MEVRVREADLVEQGPEVGRHDCNMIRGRLILGGGSMGSDEQVRRKRERDPPPSRGYLVIAQILTPQDDAPALELEHAPGRGAQ